LPASEPGSYWSRWKTTFEPTVYACAFTDFAEVCAAASSCTRTSPKSCPSRPSMSARTSGSSGRPPELTTSCTGDFSSSPWSCPSWLRCSAATTPALPAERWSWARPAAPTASHWPSVAALAACGAASSSIRAALGRRLSTASPSWS
jgi:hypothetical protein